MLSYRNPEIIEHYDFIRVSLRTIVHETMDYRTFMPLRAIYKREIQIHRRIIQRKRKIGEEILNLNYYIEKKYIYTKNYVIKNVLVLILT